MEFGSSKNPDNLASSEANEQTPLALRFHHIRLFMSFAHSHNLLDRLDKISTKEELLPFDQLYRHPEVVEDILQNRKKVQLEALERHLKGRVREYDSFDSGKEARKMAQDYTGPKGIFKQEYVNAFTDAERQFVIGDPNRKVEIGWGPDVICYACQSNGPDRPGEHCLADLGENNEDVVFYRILESIPTLPNAPQDILETTDEMGRRTFEMSLGTFRSTSLMDTIYDLYSKKLIEIASKQEANEAILSSD